MRVDLINCNGVLKKRNVWTQNRHAHRETDMHLIFTWNSHVRLKSETSVSPL